MPPMPATPHLNKWDNPVMMSAIKGAIVKPPAVQWFRRRLNVVAICISLFVPWLLFCFTCWIVSFSVHYSAPGLSYTLVALSLLFVLFLGMFAWNAWRARKHDPSHTEPTWYIFLFLTSLLAWILAMYVGVNNFYYHMEPFFGITNMRAYKGVNPAMSHGQRLMDAGMIEFTEGAHIDFDRAMSFRNKETYCVAPIVQKNSSDHGPPASYDFWAVGLNCCCGDTVRASNFQCGEYDNLKANGVVRLMHDEHRAFYRLAVQQAVGAFSIKAEHPLFFHWVQDPVAVTESYRWEGHRQFLLWMYLHFMLQIILVVLAGLTFNNMAPYPIALPTNP